jgi:hypothetical protein
MHLEDLRKSSEKRLLVVRIKAVGFSFILKKLKPFLTMSTGPQAQDQ